MSQVELKAWGAGSDYDFEIAGVCIGNPIVEDTFVFSEKNTSSEVWMHADNAVKDRVMYLYRGPEIDGPVNTAGKGDNIFRINHSEHNTPESAESIMGRGGCAMVIPTLNQKWEGREDPNIEDVPYSTDKMYFSILMRVTDSATGRQIYPYPDGQEGMRVIYYAVAPSGTLITRLYKSKTDEEYYTDTDLLQPYISAEGEIIKAFGWAAVPVDANWSAGKRYVYTLNYSEGIGIHDPLDPKPGTPIVEGKSTISWGVSVGTWDYATPADNYTPDLNVPNS